jgi:hypothetical protein
VNVDDVKVSQATHVTPHPAYEDRFITPEANSLWGFDSNKRPVKVSIGANITLVGNILSATGGGGGSGTVTNFSAGNLSPLFSTSVATSTTTPALTFSLTNQAQKTFLAGPTSGADTAPTFRTIGSTDLPDLSSIYQPLNTKLSAFSALANSIGWLHNDGAGVLSYSTPTYSDVGAAPSSTVSFPGFGTSGSTACVGNDARLSDARPASDVYAWAKAPTKPSYTYTEVGADPAGAAAAITLAGLGGVPTTRQVNGHALSSDVTVTKSDVGLGNVANSLQLVAASNLSDIANAGTARGNLGGTTVGQNLFTLANPSAITFPRINADNTVSTLDASSFRTAIGAGTSSFDGTWGSLSGKPANVVSFGSLANASGWLHNDGSGVLAYSTPTKSDVGLSAVENTALSTWAGSANIQKTGVWVSPIAYGATGSGTSDDATAIQAALNANKYVVVPYGAAGIYKVGTTIKVPSGTTLHIEKGVTIKAANGLNAPVITNYDEIGGNSDIIIFGYGVLDGNKSNQSIATATLRLTNVTDSVLRDLYVKDARNNPVGSDMGVIDLRTCSRIDLNNCDVTGGIMEGLYAFGCEKIRVNGGAYHNNSDSGIDLTKSPDSQIIGTRALNNGASGISINSQYCIVSACISDSNLWGINIGHSTSSDSSGTGTVVSGNISTNNTYNGIQTQAGYTTGVVIGKNHCYGNLYSDYSFPDGTLSPENFVTSANVDNAFGCDIVNSGVGASSFSYFRVGEDNSTKNISFQYRNNSYVGPGAGYELLIPNLGTLATNAGASGGLLFSTIANAPIKLSIGGYGSSKLVATFGGTRTLNLNGASNAYLGFDLAGVEKSVCGVDGNGSWVLYDSVNSSYRIILDGAGNLVFGSNSTALSPFHITTRLTQVIGNGYNSYYNSTNEMWREYKAYSDGLIYWTRGSNNPSGGALDIMTLSGTGLLNTIGAFKSGNPSGGTAQPWKFGGYTAGVTVQAGKVRVEINGTPYDLLTA